VNKNWLRRLSALAGLTVCFLLFQNFSLDNDYKDIRKIAPQGEMAEPRSGYFPEHIKGTSLQALGNELLKYNFSDEMKQLENKIEDWAAFEIGEDKADTAPRNPAAVNSPGTYKLRTGHLGKDRVGFSLESDVKVKCEYSALKQDVQLSLEKALGRNANLSFKHRTEEHQSSVNFSYAW